MTTDLKSEIRDKEEKAQIRREDLRLSAQNMKMRRTRMNFWAGLLALFSSGTVAAVVTDVLSDEQARVLAAVVAFASGALSLSIRYFFSEDQSQKMLEGANGFLKLSHSANQLLNASNTSDEELGNGLTALQREYAELDSVYGEFRRDT